MAKVARRRLVTVLAPLIIVGTVLGFAPNAAAARYPGAGDPFYSGFTECGTMQGPLRAVTDDYTYYIFVWSINGRPWQWSNWYVSLGDHNWIYLNNNWSWRQTVQVTPWLNPGDSITMWAYVSRYGFTDWVYLGQCSRGGIITVSGGT